MKPFTAAGLITVLCLTPAPVGADDAPKGDLAKMQGKWKGMVGPEMNIPLVLEVKGNAVQLVVTPPQGQDITLRGEIKIDDTAKPKTWDWTKFTGPDGQAAPDNLAVYEIEGDTLKVCSGGPGNPRPTEVKAGEGGPPNLVTLTRVKDADKDKDK